MKHQPIHKEKLDLKTFPKTDSNPSFAKVCCPSCKTDISTTDVNIQDKIAKCTSCDVIFPIQDSINQLHIPEKAKQEVLRPEGVDLFYYKNELEIAVRPPMVTLEILLISLAPFFTLLSFPLYFFEGFSIWWPIAGTLIAVLSTLYLFQRQKHKTYLHIDDNYLSIQWRPKKLKKDRIYAVQDIDQLYVRKGNGYMLYMTVNGEEGQKHVCLLGGMMSISKVRYLEQEIERHLGITDRAVPEEMG